MVSVRADLDNGFFLTQSGINSSLPEKMSERTVLKPSRYDWAFGYGRMHNFP